MSGHDGNTSRTMRIAVVGVGSIGSAFAFQLARTGGHQVTAVARPGSPRFEQVRRDGGIVNEMGERADLQVVDKLEEQVPYDLVLVTLLAHQVEAVLPALRRSAAKAILFMFNIFEPEQLRDAVGAERCSFGLPLIQAFLEEDGKLNAKIGVGGQKSRIDREEWVHAFNAAGIPAAIESEMLLRLRCQVPLGAAMESISVAAMRRSRGASWSEAMVIARGAQAGFTLIERLGYRIYPSGKAFLHASPTGMLASVLWSLSRVKSFRELLATGQNECRALVDTMVASAVRDGHSDLVGPIVAMKPLP